MTSNRTAPLKSGKPFRLPKVTHVRQIIPAAPGWFYVEPVTADKPEDDEIWQIEIIEWACESNYAESRDGGGVSTTSSEPVLPGYLFGCTRQWGIRSPDCVIRTDGGECAFKTDAAALQHWRGGGL